MRMPAEMTGLEFEIRGNTANALSSIERLKRSLTGLSPTARNAGNSMRSAGRDAKNAGDNFSKSANNISKFVASMKRILMYRTIRWVLSSITQAIKEGINNMYEYSRVAGGEFANAMNTAKSAATTWKNSLAAAFAPLIEWVIPYLKIAVEWIVRFNNALGALFAALTGKKSYTAAIWYQDQYKESVEGTTGAVKELQRYLAPFDELNVLPANGGGGGGGGGGSPDFADMFEERELPDWAKGIKEFLDKIRGWIGDFWDWLSAGIVAAIAWLKKKWEALKDWASEKWAEFKESIRNWLPEKVAEKVPALVTLALEFALSPAAAALAAGSFIKERMKSVSTIKQAIVTLALAFALSPTAATIAAVDWIKANVKQPQTTLETVVTLALTFALSPVTGAIKAAEWLKTKFSDVKVQVPALVELALEFAVSPAAGAVSLFNAVKEKLTGASLSTATGVAVTAELISVNVKDSFLQKLKDRISAITHSENIETTASVTVVPEVVGVKIKDSFRTQLQERLSGVTNGVEVGVGVTADTSTHTHTSGSYAPTTSTSSAYDPSTLTENVHNAIMAAVTGTALVGLIGTALGGGIQTALTGAFAGMPTLEVPVEAYADKLEDRVPSSDKTIGGMSATFESWKRGWGSSSGWNWMSIIASLTSWARSSNWYSAGWDKIALKGVITSWSNAANGVSVGGGYFAFTKALGGAFFGGRWHDIPQYAAGTLNAGSMFIAGEAGPELVGHIGGRTEVLNQSQIASAIAAGVSSASYSNDGIDEDTMYRAFVRALNDANNGGDIYLDGEVVYRAVVNRNKQASRRTGMNPLLA